MGKEGLDFFNKMFDIGDFIQAEGVMFRTKTGEVTLHVHTFSLLAKSVSPLPAAKDETLEDGTVLRHAALEDPELRARQRYADLAVNPDVRETFRKRAGIIKALREFLDDKGRADETQRTRDARGRWPLRYIVADKLQGAARKLPGLGRLCDWLGGTLGGWLHKRYAARRGSGSPPR